MAKWSKGIAAAIGTAVGGLATAFFPDLLDTPEKSGALTLVLTTVLVYFAPRNS